MKKFNPLLLIILFPILLMIILLNSGNKDFSKTIDNKSPKVTTETIGFLCDYDEGLHQTYLKGEGKPYAYLFEKSTEGGFESFNLKKILFDENGRYARDGQIQSRTINEGDFQISWQEKNGSSYNYRVLDRNTLTISEPVNVNKINCINHDADKTLKIITQIKNERIKAYQKELDERQF